MTPLRGAFNNASLLGLGFRWPVFSKHFDGSTLESYPADLVSKARSTFMAAKEADEVNTMPELHDLLVRLYDIKGTAYFSNLFRIVSNEYEGHPDGLVLVFYIFDSILSDKSDRFSRCDAEGTAANAQAFKSALESKMPQTYMALEKLGALPDSFLGAFFVDLFEDFLSPANQLKVMDAYFLEGTKILYRYGLGLIGCYKKQIKASEYKTPEAFWAALKAGKGSESFEAIQTAAFDSDVSIIGKILQPSRYSLSRKQISTLSSKDEASPTEDANPLVASDSAPDFDSTSTTIPAVSAPEPKDDVQESTQNDDGDHNPLMSSLTKENNSEAVDRPDSPLHQNAATAPLSTDAMKTDEKAEVVGKKDEESDNLPLKKGASETVKAAPVVKKTKKGSCCC